MIFPPTKNNKEENETGNRTSPTHTANIALKESSNEQYRIEGAFVVPPSLMQIPLGAIKNKFSCRTKTMIFSC